MEVWIWVKRERRIQCLWGQKNGKGFQNCPRKGAGEREEKMGILRNFPLTVEREKLIVNLTYE